MRTKRTKQYKRLMALYSFSFGFREPYQILVDGDFMYTALKFKMDICKQLRTVLLGNTKQMYTSCTLAEVRKRGEGWSETEMALEQFERRGCSHKKRLVSSTECLASIIASDNPHNYCVATQNESLRELFRTVPGVPLLYINRSVLIVEPPSGITLEKVKQIEVEKTRAPHDEIKFLKKANSSTINKNNGEHAKKQKKRKGPKEPNPLSRKKKKSDSSSALGDTQKSVKSKTYTKEKNTNSIKRKHDELSDDINNPIPLKLQIKDGKTNKNSDHID
ncbi:4226_t:CDS:2, partial [Acaulospora morrowiae]